MGLHTLAAIQFFRLGPVSSHSSRAYAAFQISQATIRVFLAHPLFSRADSQPCVRSGSAGQRPDDTSLAALGKYDQRSGQ